MMPTLRRAARALLIAGSLLPWSLAHAAGYETIEPPQNTSTDDQVEVIEFFWLGCPHCYEFEPTIEAWAENKPDYIAFIREAPPLNPSWESHSRSFYAAELLGHGNEFVEAMFNAIHEQRKPMRKPSDIADLAAEVGMERELFLKTMDSFAVETRMRRAIQLAQGAGITGVPAVAINGKYLTSANLAGGYPGIIEVIEERAAAEKQSMGLN